MNSNAVSEEQIRREGLRALREALGPVGMVRFIQMFQKGSGDYTAERHQWLDGLTIDDIAAEIEREEWTGYVQAQDYEGLEAFILRNLVNRCSWVWIEDDCIESRLRASRDDSARRSDRDRVARRVVRGRAPAWNVCLRTTSSLS